MAKPIEVLDWATSDIVDPTSGQDNKKIPPAGKKTDGWDYKEFAPRQYFNYLFEGYFNWIAWIENELDNPGVSGDSGIGTAAGRDVGTASGEVPVFGSVQDLNVNEINGSISHATDTGSVTNDHLRQVICSSTSQATGVNSQVNACTNCTATGTQCGITGCGNSDVPGIDAFVGGCAGCTNTGNQALIAGSNGCTLGNLSNECAIIAGNNCDITPAGMKYGNAVIASTYSDLAGSRGFIAACSGLSGYEIEITADATEAAINTSLITGTGEITIAGNQAEINASYATSTESISINTNASQAQINCSNDCQISPTSAKPHNQINGCNASSITGQQCQINAASHTTATGYRSVVSGGDYLDNQGDNSIITSSLGSTINNVTIGTLAIQAGIHSCVILTTGTISNSGMQSEINASRAAAGEALTISSYATQAQINASQNCTIPPTGTKSNIQINASTDSHSLGWATQINASTYAYNDGENCSITASLGTSSNDIVISASATRSAINTTWAADTGEVDNNGDQSEINASLADTGETLEISSYANQSQINASTDCQIDPTGAKNNIQINASKSSKCVNNSSIVSASLFVKSATDYAICGGSGTTPASTANRTWEIGSTNGDITYEGTLGVGPLSDIAEMFENLNKGEIPAGTIVSLKGRKLILGGFSDRILGIVSKNPSFLGGDSPFTWAGRYMTDEFGVLLYDEIPDPDWKGKKKDTPKIKVRRQNPDFDITQENIPRRERKDEWTAVALTGQIHARLKSDVGENDYVNADGSKSDTPTRIECMEITQKYSSKKGYAIALCLIR